MINTDFRTALPDYITLKLEERGSVVSILSFDDLMEVIKLANITNTSIVPDFGQSISKKEVVLLDISGLNAVNHYRPDEFLINVETGMTVEQLNETLEAQEQKLPLLYAPSRRLLQILGEDTFSLSSTRYGNLGRWIVGLEAVTGDGERIHYGGEVVKNVTGYDLNRLFVGSRHHYGLITSVIFKLEPIPPVSRSFLFHADDFEQALDLTIKLERLLYQIDVLTLFKTKTSFGWHVVVTLSGRKELVQRECEITRDAIFHLKPDLQELDMTPRALEHWVQKLDWLSFEEPDALVVRIALSQKQISDFYCRFFVYPWFKVADMLIPFNTHQMLLRWINVNLPDISDLWEMHKYVSSNGGFVEILRYSANYTTSDIEGFNADPQPAVKQWTKRLKSNFDPCNVLGEML